MTWVRFLGYAAFSALGQVYQVVILDKILSVVPTLVLIHITIINCKRETNDAKGNVRGVSSLLSISSK
jgi:hypothetical protein